MRPLKRLISVDEALRIALEAVVTTHVMDSVHIREATGRVAAEDVISRTSVPPFSRSAMDGYAVRARDTYGASKLRPVKLRSTETVYAGGVPKRQVAKRRCAEIATGAMLPKGADAVVMVEDTELEDGTVLVYDSVHPGENVSKKGEDIVPGARVVSRGEVLNPGRIGALAAIGRADVKVYARPLVAIVPTGNEVVELGSRLGLGQVYNINSYTLSGMVQANGGQVRALDIVDDSVPELECAVKENRDCDMMVFSGGSSVGERDILVDVLERKGKVLFHGIAMKPGKPTLFGVIGDQLVWGMPGYPTACLSNAYVLLAPVLRKMARLPPTSPMHVEARMAKRMVSTTGRTQFLTVRVEDGIAHPVFKESGAITSMALADGYVIIPPDVDLVEKDEQVRVFLF